MRRSKCDLKEMSSDVLRSSFKGLQRVDGADDAYEKRLRAERSQERLSESSRKVLYLMKAPGSCREFNSRTLRRNCIRRARAGF